jgi:murein DD-endopeptidase MepM/ murein hydrolase activator NlpD
MNLSSIEKTIPATTQLSAAKGADEIAARRAAVQFEALLLAQFTAAMNPTSTEEEDNVFSSTGADMYKQMFSEQMAKIMADNGGIGIAETIMRQLREKAAATNDKPAALERAMAGVKAIKQEKAASAAPSDGFKAEIIAPSKKPVALQLPLAGRITSEFGTRTDPINGQHRNHHGIDIAAPRGTPIGAAAAGTVVFAGRRGGYGNTVIIEQANGKQTLYAHADQLLVKVGDQINAGQEIATVGSTGRSTGPHLHFEVRDNGQPINPLTTLAKDFALPDR